jgi:tetratricopeptide (TPR) repeat protein
VATERIQVEIRIRDFAAPDGGYLVTAAATPGDLSAEGRFDPASMSNDAVSEAIEAMEKGGLDAVETMLVGRRLYDALISDDIATLYETAQTLGPIRIRLTIDVPAAQIIPWELMHDGERFLAIASPLSRGISSLSPAEPPTATLPMRILVVDAFPTGVPKLESQLEASNIVDSLEPLIGAGLADVVLLSGATLSNLLDALRTAGATPDPGPFHAIHFIGHSTIDAAGRGFLLFENSDGTPHPVSPGDLIDVIGDYDLKLIFLNSCESVGTSALATADTFAPALLGSGIPAVIGMQTSVFDGIARTFSKEFYGALADNSPVDQALTDARRIVKTSGRQYVADIGVPVCYLRSQSGRILDLQPKQEEEPTRSRRLFTKMSDWVIGAVVGALVLGVMGVAWDWLQGPDQMNELAFNVAVAEFAAADGASASTANDLSVRLFEQLEGALVELQFTDVWGPEQAGRVDGTTAEERAENAEDLADRINADVVVFGVLQGELGNGEFLPEFFINDRQLSGASELTGPYTLGDGDPFDSSLDAVDELQAQLAGRANGLAQFVIGLSAYSRNAYDRALPRLEQALSVSGWSDEDGKEVLWLFLGNTHGRLLDYDSAGDAFEEALRIEPDYARALIGRADITFQRSRGGCFPPADPAGLQLAADQFRSALEAPDPPPLADIAVKGAYGLGRVFLCEQVGGIDTEPAAAQFEQVIDAFDRGDEATQRRLAELASESHANLGVVFATVNPVDLDRAIEEYQEGIDLSDDDERKAVFLGNQADAYRRAGDCDAAKAALNEALDLTESASLVQRLATERDALSC